MPYCMKLYYCDGNHIQTHHHPIIVSGYYIMKEIRCSLQPITQYSFPTRNTTQLIHMASLCLISPATSDVLEIETHAYRRIKQSEGSPSVLVHLVVQHTDKKETKPTIYAPFSVLRHFDGNATVTREPLSLTPCLQP